MANTTKVNANSLIPGTRIFLTGKVAFSHISRLTTDDEREKNNTRKADNYKAKHPGEPLRVFGMKDNYSYINLRAVNDIKVLEKKAVASPEVEKLAKQFISDRLFQNKDGEWCYDAISKSPILPTVLVRDPDDNAKVYEKQVNCKFIASTGKYEAANADAESKRLEGELKTGLNVTIELRIFGSPKGNNGVSLDRVIVNDRLELFKPVGNRSYDSGLEVLGITDVTPPPTNEQVSYSEPPITEINDIGEPDATADPFAVDTGNSVFGNDNGDINGRFVGAGDHNPASNKPF